MKDFLESISISNWISILSSFATILISIVSICIALKSLKVAKQSIVEANRPYVVCYLSFIDVGNPATYLVIKNFGVTGATIKSITCNKTFENNNYRINGFLKNFNNHFIAPGQSFATVFIDSPKTECEIFEFDIVYSNNSTTFTEKIRLNTNFNENMIYFNNRPKKTNSTSDLNVTIKNVAHSFAKTKL